jgi:hypothetical protein
MDGHRVSTEILELEQRFVARCPDTIVVGTENLLLPIL